MRPRQSLSSPGCGAPVAPTVRTGLPRANSQHGADPRDDFRWAKPPLGSTCKPGDVVRYRRETRTLVKRVAPRPAALVTGTSPVYFPAKCRHTASPPRSQCSSRRPVSPRALPPAVSQDDPRHGCSVGHLWTRVRLPRRLWWPQRPSSAGCVVLGVRAESHDRLRQRRLRPCRHARKPSSSRRPWPVCPVRGIPTGTGCPRSPHGGGSGACSALQR